MVDIVWTLFFKGLLLYGHPSLHLPLFVIEPSLMFLWTTPQFLSLRGLIGLLHAAETFSEVTCVL